MKNILARSVALLLTIGLIQDPCIAAIGFSPEAGLVTAHGVIFERTQDHPVQFRTFSEQAVVQPTPGFLAPILKKVAVMVDLAIRSITLGSEGLSTSYFKAQWPIARPFYEWLEFGSLNPQKWPGHRHGHATQLTTRLRLFLGEVIAPMIVESSILSTLIYAGIWLLGLFIPLSVFALVSLVAGLHSIQLFMHAISLETRRHWFHGWPRVVAGWKALRWEAVYTQTNRRPLAVFLSRTTAWLAIFYLWHPSGWLSTLLAYGLLANVPHALIDWLGDAIDQKSALAHLFESHADTALYAYRDLSRRLMRRPGNEIWSIPPVLSGLGFREEFLATLMNLIAIREPIQTRWDPSNPKAAADVALDPYPGRELSHFPSDIRRMLAWGYLEMAWRLAIHPTARSAELKLVPRALETARRLYRGDGQPLFDLHLWRELILLGSFFAHLESPMLFGFARYKKLQQWIATYWPAPDYKTGTQQVEPDLESRHWDEFFAHPKWVLHMPASEPYSPGTIPQILARIELIIEGLGVRNGSDVEGVRANVARVLELVLNKAFAASQNERGHFVTIAVTVGGREFTINVIDEALEQALATDYTPREFDLAALQGENLRTKVKAVIEDGERIGSQVIITGRLPDEGPHSDPKHMTAHIRFQPMHFPSRSRTPRNRFNDRLGQAG